MIFGLNEDITELREDRILKENNTLEILKAMGRDERALAIERIRRIRKYD